MINQLNGHFTFLKNPTHILSIDTEMSMYGLLLE